MPTPRRLRREEGQYSSPGYLTVRTRPGKAYMWRVFGKNQTNWRVCEDPAENDNQVFFGSGTHFGAAYDCVTPRGVLYCVAHCFTKGEEIRLTVRTRGGMALRG